MSNFENTGSTVSGSDTGTDSQDTGTGTVDTGSSQDTGSSPGQDTGQSTPEAKAQARSFKVKNGSFEREFKTDEEIQHYLGLGVASDKRFKEASAASAQAKQQIQRAQNFYDRMKKDPMAALSDPALGLSKEQIRENLENYYRKEFIEEESLTAEQKELRDLKSWKKGQEDLAETAKQKQEHETHTAQTEHFRQALQTEIIAGLEAADLPGGPSNIRKAAYILRLADERGIDLTPAQLAKEIQSQIQSDAVAAFSKASGEQIIKMLGDDIINKVRAADVARLRGGQVQQQQKQIQQAQPSKAAVSMDQVADYFDKLK